MPCSHFEWETQSDRPIGKVWNFRATTSVFLLKLRNVRSIYETGFFFFYRWRVINVKCSFKYRVQVTQTITTFQTKCPCIIFNKFCMNDISFFHKINLHDDRLILFFYIVCQIECFSFYYIISKLDVMTTKYTIFCRKKWINVNITLLDE